MPKVSVLFGTARPGGLDITFNGLLNQSFTDFEVIFVDGRYHKRHAQVLDYLKSIGFKQPVYHVPNIRYNGMWATTCAGFNTEFMLAEGELGVKLVDYAWTQPDWLELHVANHEAYDTPHVVIGPHIYLSLPPIKAKGDYLPIRWEESINWTDERSLKTRDAVRNQFEQFDEISAFETPFEPKMLDSLQTLAQFPPSEFPDGSIGWEWMHSKNESYPIQSLYDINGMDENYDKGLGPGDLEMGFRLRRLGLDFVYSRQIAVFCPNPRVILPNLRATLAQRWQTPEDKALNPERWSNDEGLQYYNKRLSEVTQTGDVRSKTPYDLREKKKEILGWREKSQEREPVLPYMEVSDTDWFISSTPTES